MSNPLAVEKFEFTVRSRKTHRPVQKSGKEIIAVCHEVISTLAADSDQLTGRLIKTYRRGEKFTPCLTVVTSDNKIDNKHPSTVYVRPGLRNFNQGFNPEREYSKLYVVSGLSADVALTDSDETYDNTQASIEAVRQLRKLLTVKLGGRKLLDRQLKCVLCGQWVVPAYDNYRPECQVHGVNPPTWLAVET